MKIMLTTAACLASLTAPALADEFSTAIEDYITSTLGSWAEDPQLVAAIRAQNSATEGYDQARIDTLDTQWREQVGMTDAPIVSSVVDHPLSDYLRAAVERSEGAILEIFVMDMHGLNVAASAPTSDYWQGDEVKFSETYGRGSGVSHVSDVEFDESTQSYQGQVSMTVSDPATGEAVGAVTFGVDPEAVM